MDSQKKVAVLGGGSFGTVLANLAASNGNQVSLWVRDSEQALRINSEGANTTYHPELRLSENIQASDSLKNVMKNAKFQVGSIKWSSNFAEFLEWDFAQKSLTL